MNIQSGKDVLYRLPSYVSPLSGRSHHKILVFMSRFQYGIHPCSAFNERYPAPV